MEYPSTIECAYNTHGIPQYHAWNAAAYTTHGIRLITHGICLYHEWNMPVSCLPRVCLWVWQYASLVSVSGYMYDGAAKKKVLVRPKL